MQIGILLCGHAMPEVEKNHGDFDAMFARLLDGRGLSFRPYDVENMEFPKSPGEMDGWLLTGSKHGVYENHPFIPPLEDFIRTSHTAKAPMVGICFGHQIIAQALGGKVEKYSGGWSVGRTGYDFTSGDTLMLNAWHQDQVIRAPEGAATVASNEFCTYAALTYGEHIYTVQPHPEITGPILADYVRHRRGTGTYPDAIMDRALAKAAIPTDEAQIADQIAQFFQAAHAAKRESSDA